MQIGSRDVRAHRLIDEFLQRNAHPIAARVTYVELNFFDRGDGLRDSIVSLLHLCEVGREYASTLDIAKDEFAAQRGDAAVIRESVAYGPPLVVVVHQYRICQAVFLTPVQHICREWEQLAEFTASPPAVLPDSFALHPTVVLSIAYDVDLLDVVHTDVGSKHGP